MRISKSDFQMMVGREIGVSRWFNISQDRIDLFAETTEDRQFIHIDRTKAEATPFGGTIAHGFLTLSMLSAIAQDALVEIEGLTHSVNYGFNHIRFVSPVRSEANIRGKFVLSDLTQTESYQTRNLTVTVEIEGEAKPALIAEWLTRHYFA